MITFGVTRSGDGVFDQRVKRLSTVLKSDSVLRTIENGLDKISDWVRRDARYRTGYMRKSVRTFTHGKAAAITVDAYYGRFIERGTEHHRAFPFFFVNVHTGMDQVMKDVRALYMK